MVEGIVRTLHTQTITRRNCADLSIRSWIVDKEADSFTKIRKRESGRMKSRKERMYELFVSLYSYNNIGREYESFTRLCPKEDTILLQHICFSYAYPTIVISMVTCFASRMESWCMKALELMKYYIAKQYSFLLPQQFSKYSNFLELHHRRELNMILRVIAKNTHFTKVPIPRWSPAISLGPI